MDILFIENVRKENLLKKYFKVVELKDKKIVINKNLANTKIKNKRKIVKKLKKILLVNNCRQAIISKDLKLDSVFLNLLNSENIDIVNGRKLFKMYILEIIDYIIKKQNIQKNNCKIAIITNQYSSFVEIVIKELVFKCKNLQIVTNHINQFEKIENDLYDEGIIITVTNNKRKSLISSDIILNIDFPSEILNLYNIYDKATIVNFEEDIKIKKKRFSGIVINWYKLGLNNETDFLEVIEKKDLDIYDLNDLIEYGYYLNKLKMEDVWIKSLITSSKQEY